MELEACAAKSHCFGGGDAAAQMVFELFGLKMIQIKINLTSKISDQQRYETRRRL